MKYKSATTAYPIPEPALVPMPMNALATRMPPQDCAAPEAAWATMPRIDTKTNIGRRPYMLESGDHISGNTPDVMMATVRQYEACWIVICRALDSSPYAEFYSGISVILGLI